VEAARAVMEAEGGGVRLQEGRRLSLEYSQQPFGGGGGGGGAAAHSRDWVCSRCRGTNFARSGRSHFPLIHLRLQCVFPGSPYLAFE